jgi:hypothetical protein
MTKIDQNMSQYDKMVCRNIILTSVHLLVVLCELLPMEHKVI